MLKLLIVFTLSLSLAFASLHSRFRHFEEIHPQNIHIRSKRDTRNPELNTKTANFEALGKTFSLKLYPDTSIFSDSFEVHLIDAHGKNTQTQINTDGVYSGHEANKPQNKVNALNHGGSWYFHIWTPQDVFVIEPLWRLDPQRTGNQHIAYTSKDVLSNKTAGFNDKVPFCRASKKLLSQSTQNVQPRRPTLVNGPGIWKESTDIHNRVLKRQQRSADGDTSGSRQRRNGDEQDTCDVFVVVDFLAFKGAGRRSPEIIVNYLSYLFKNIDTLFKNSIEMSGIRYGVMLRAVMIHTEFTQPSDGELSYNMADNNMNDVDTIVSFMKQVPTSLQYCISHLITERNFGDVLGVATIASPSLSDPNGICTGQEGEPRNAGLTTTIGPTGHLLAIDTHVITAAHEIGHNFGATHDPKDSVNECAPSSSEGGKYIMYPTAGSQRGPNAKVFSPCSGTKIKAVLKAKAHKCFMSRNSLRSFCGDGMVSPQEDCDSGFFEFAKGTVSDKCCTSKCRFSPGAVCSPNHDPCCTKNCQIAPNTQHCVRDVANDCVKESICNGVDASICPRPSPKPNYTPCSNGGMCWHGRCKSFCESLGTNSTPHRQLETCNCEGSTQDMCRLCCMDVGKDRKCRPMGGRMSDGSLCLNGVCHNGVCDKEKVDAILGRVQADEAGDDEEGSGGIRDPVALGIAFIGLAVVGAVVVIVGTVYNNRKKQSDSRRPSIDEELIQELREALQKAIGHLNVSPEDENEPTQIAIREQLEKERKKNTKFN